jgi:hypothetical protein
MALDKFLSSFNIDRQTFLQTHWTEEQPCTCSKPADEIAGLDRKHHTAQRVYFEFKRYNVQYCVTLLGPTTVPRLDTANLAVYDAAICTGEYVVVEYDCPNYAARHLHSTPLAAVRAKCIAQQQSTNNAQPSAGRRLLNAAMRYIA